ncbi:MAG: hypothetical protein Q8Q48_00790 [Candidatus Staskawiczbacteria bacterium]|nr:hypothetical protein [Candidatus Staskawiczbacteria bacterium]
MENKAKKTNLTQNKKKTVIVWIFLAVFVFAILIFVDWFCFLKIKEGSEKILSSKGDIKTAGLQAKEVQKFKAEYGSYQQNLEKIDKMFVDPQNPLDFIEFLENLASDLNIDLVISPLVPSKDAKFKTISLTLTSSGEFSGTALFLEKIERGPYLISVNNFEASGEEKAKVILSVSVLSR